MRVNVGVCCQFVNGLNTKNLLRPSFFIFNDKETAMMYTVLYPLYLRISHFELAVRKIKKIFNKFHKDFGLNSQNAVKGYICLGNFFDCINAVSLLLGPRTIIQILAKSWFYFI